MRTPIAPATIVAAIAWRDSRRVQPRLRSRTALDPIRQVVVTSSVAAPCSASARFAPRKSILGVLHATRGAARSDGARALSPQQWRQPRHRRRTAGGAPGCV
jgi:hypothetical protein